MARGSLSRKSGKGKTSSTADCCQLVRVTRYLNNLVDAQMFVVFSHNGSGHFRFVDL